MNKGFSTKEFTWIAFGRNNLGINCASIPATSKAPNIQMKFLGFMPVKKYSTSG